MVVMPTQQHPYPDRDGEPAVRRRLVLDGELAQWLDQQNDPDQLVEDLLFALRAYGDARQAVEVVDEGHRAPESEQAH